MRPRSFGFAGVVRSGPTRQPWQLQCATFATLSFRVRRALVHRASSDPVIRHRASTARRSDASARQGLAHAASRDVDGAPGAAGVVGRTAPDAASALGCGAPCVSVVLSRSSCGGLT